MNLTHYNIHIDSDMLELWAFINSYNCIYFIEPLSCFIIYNYSVNAIYRMDRNFGGKIFWRIAENMSFGGIYFGS